VAEAVAAGRAGQPILDDSGILGLLATPEQKAAIDKVQALMSLLEGHGHVVMDRIGARILPSQARMSAILKARRKDPRTAALFRLLGMEMKMKQYELGEAFISAIDKEVGWDRLDRAWESAESLPTLNEIHHPHEWLRRVA
jgi:putative hydrolase